MRVLDSTLREGELFRALPNRVRLMVASKLADSGVTRVELTVDYPPRTSFEDNAQVVRALHDRGVEVVLHGRAVEQDLASMARYDAEGCALYIAVSRLHRQYKLHGISEDEAAGRLVDGVTRARELGFGYIRATLEDASRVFLEEVDQGAVLFQRLAEGLRAAGATMLSLPDTSGLMTPGSARAFFRSAKSLSALPLSAHFHNDYGFASANTTEAVLEGAEEAHVTIMGVGDRNGIADMYEVVAALEDIHGIRTGIDRRSLRPLYSWFAKAAGVELPWRHPLSEHARTVRAGVHQSMTVRRSDGYIPAKKLTNDFGEPLYAVSPYVSHALVQTILNPHGELDSESSRRVAEALARRFTGSAPTVRGVREVIMEETGVDVPESELGRYFAAERLYILLKLKPQYPAQELLTEISALGEVDAVDEVYGDADMVVRARAAPGRGNVVEAIKRRYGDAIEEMRVLVTD